MGVSTLSQADATELRTALAAKLERGRGASAEEWPQTLPGGPVREEPLAWLLQHARLARYGSHFFATRVCLSDGL